MSGASGGGRIRSVRAYAAGGAGSGVDAGPDSGTAGPAPAAGADYHDQPAGHWIDDHIATPMSIYPEYRASRQSFGLNVLGTLVVELETDSGVTGFAVSTGGDLGAWIVERHLARFLEGAELTGPEDIALLWDQMYRSTLFYGRKGVVLNTISAVDLALWDLLGQLRRQPVHALLGGAVRDEQPMYATGARPDLAQQLGFIGGKMPLHHGPAEGEAGMQQNLDALADMRGKVGPDFSLMWDCWMSLDLPYALALADGASRYGLRWLEEALPPDDYSGYAQLRAASPESVQITTGEHEATRWGFQLLLEKRCADILQPDVGWCGGLTELLHITKDADAAGVLVVPHGSSVYSYHYVMTQRSSPFAEFLMMAPGADRVVPMFDPLLLDEPVPRDGRIRIDQLDRPGFGVRLNPEVPLRRPYRH